jgi:hypothetical protein
VGEHASIASFAAFTIALMSNQAPPDLIEDSLSAAQDELRHATTSFEMASLLLETMIKPGPFPPSKLEFGHNLTALALGVAREGCIDETLSALALAASVDENNNVDDALLALLREKTLQIAREEGNHSILAWRTIEWVCSVDPNNACAAVREEVLNRKYLDEAVVARFASSDAKTLDNAWTLIHETLVPLVTRNGPQVPKVTSMLDIEDEQFEQTAMLAKSIVDGVRGAIIGFDLQTTAIY